MGGECLDDFFTGFSGFFHCSDILEFQLHAYTFACEWARTGCTYMYVLKQKKKHTAWLDRLSSTSLLLSRVTSAGVSHSLLGTLAKMKRREKRVSDMARTWGGREGWGTKYLLLCTL